MRFDEAYRKILESASQGSVFRGASEDEVRKRAASRPRPDMRELMDLVMAHGVSWQEIDQEDVSSEWKRIAIWSATEWHPHGVDEVDEPTTVLIVLTEEPDGSALLTYQLDAPDDRVADGGRYPSWSAAIEDVTDAGLDHDPAKVGGDA